MGLKTGSLLSKPLQDLKRFSSKWAKDTQNPKALCQLAAQSDFAVTVHVSLNSYQEIGFPGSPPYQQSVEVLERPGYLGRLHARRAR